MDKWLSYQVLTLEIAGSNPAPATSRKGNFIGIIEKGGYHRDYYHRRQYPD